MKYFIILILYFLNFVASLIVLFGLLKILKFLYKYCSRNNINYIYTWKNISHLNDEELKIIKDGFIYIFSGALTLSLFLTIINFLGK